MPLSIMVHAVRSHTLIGGCGEGGGGGISSVLRIQKGNSLTTLAPYDLETVTRSKYLHHKHILQQWPVALLQHVTTRQARRLSVLT